MIVSINKRSRQWDGCWEDKEEGREEERKKGMSWKGGGECMLLAVVQVYLVFDKAYFVAISITQYRHHHISFS